LTDRAFRDPINVPPTAEPSEAASVPASAQGIARLSGGLKRRLTLFAPPLCAKNDAEVIAAHIVGIRQNSPRGGADREGSRDYMDATQGLCSALCSRRGRNMNTDAVRPSAKIYQFPVRVRSAGASTRNDSGKGAANIPRATVSVGAAWYHEAAIQEDRPRKP
jgi:hypothetical protein